MMVTSGDRPAPMAGEKRLITAVAPRWPLELTIWLAAFVAATIPGVAVLLWQTLLVDRSPGTASSGANGVLALLLVVVMAALLAAGVLHVVLSPLQWLLHHAAQDAERPRHGIVGALAASLSGAARGQQPLSPGAPPAGEAAAPAQPAFLFTPPAPRSTAGGAGQQDPSGDLRAAMHQLTTRIGQTARDAQGQAVAGSRTIRQMEMMAVSASGVSERTTEAATVAGEAVVAVGTGQDALLNAQTAMALIRETTLRAARQVKVLGESAQFVRQAVGQVQYSADELHLIAGNASIEAARHPHAAGFFRNVADSIEQLAQQSQVALGEIQQAIEANRQETGRVSGVIEDVVVEVGRGTAAVTAAGQALDTINEVVGRLAGLNQNIAAASREQVRVAATVAEGIDDLAGNASATARGVAEQAEMALYVERLVDQHEAAPAAAGGRP